MSRLPHVVWDMGGIIYRYFTELMLDVGAERGWPIDKIPMGPTGPVHDADYDRLIANDFDELDYLVIVNKRMEQAGLDFDPVRDLSASWTLRPEVWDTIKQIGGRGHRQAVLTNDATRWLGDNWWETWEGREHFDAVIDVQTVGVRKPAPEPYLAIVEALGAPPNSCLFIDDMPINCRGAEEVGMDSHLFVVADPVESCRRLLERLG